MKIIKDNFEEAYNNFVIIKYNNSIETGYLVNGIRPSDGSREFLICRFKRGWGVLNNHGSFTKKDYNIVTKELNLEVGYFISNSPNSIEIIDTNSQKDLDYFNSISPDINLEYEKD